jgi:hypothetical protein
MRERHGEPIGRLNGHDFATGRDSADERDRPGRGRDDRVSSYSADVDPAVLTRSVRIVAKDEFLEHGTFDGPGPGSRSGHNDEGRRERDDQGSAHLPPPCCLICQRRTVPVLLSVVNMDYRDVS